MSQWWFTFHFFCLIILTLNLADIAENFRKDIRNKMDYNWEYVYFRLIQVAKCVGKIKYSSCSTHLLLYALFPNFVDVHCNCWNCLDVTTRYVCSWHSTRHPFNYIRKTQVMLSKHNSTNISTSPLYVYYNTQSKFSLRATSKYLKVFVMFGTWKWAMMRM